jgi:outer membrane immunogenic protein
MLCYCRTSVLPPTLMAALLALAAATPASAQPPYDGWRGVRSGSPSYAGGSDRRPLDGSPRYGQSYTAYAPPPAPTYRKEIWSGFYAGGHLGGGWGTSLPRGLAGDSVQLDGFTGGLQAGHNWQFGAFVVGAEADASLSGIDGMRLYPGTASAAAASMDWMATLRGRAGFAWDSMLFYGTAGLAIGGLSSDLVTPGAVTGASGTRSGFVWGGGVEMKINPQLSVRVESLRTNYADQDVGTPIGPVSIGTDVTTVRAGLNWHFNW